MRQGAAIFLIRSSTFHRDSHRALTFSSTDDIFEGPRAFNAGFNVSNVSQKLGSDETYSASGAFAAGAAVAVSGAGAAARTHFFRSGWLSGVEVLRFEEM
jgi:hypothetical protein